MLVAATTLGADAFCEDRAELNLQSQVSVQYRHHLRLQVDRSSVRILTNQRVRDGLVGRQCLRALVWGVEEGVTSSAVAGLRRFHLVG